MYEHKIWGGYPADEVSNSLSSELLDPDMIEWSGRKWDWRAIEDTAFAIVLGIAGLAIVMALAIN